MAKEFQFK